MKNLKCEWLDQLKIVLSIVALVLTVPVSAVEGGGLFIEPGVTYETSDGDINWPAPLNDSTSELEGFGLSARLGFHINDAFFVGADGRYSQPRFKNSAGDSEVDAEAYNWGPVLGVQMPVVGLRVWGTYILGAGLDPDAYTAGGSDLDGEFEEGEGYRIGAGFKVFMLSVNLEYQRLAYDQARLNELGPFSPGSVFDSVELEDESWILGVSFPFAL